jgi:drug/metabolite transporter (DMT)-like permease
LFVLAGSYLYFGEFPDFIALLGGGVTILGVLLISFGKIRFQKNNFNKA